MLARSLKLTLNGKIVGETPMLVPAFSSKVVPDIGLIIKPLEEYMANPILISAYDIYYGEKFTKIDFPIIFGEIIFLDSGGYECAKDSDLADIVYPDYEPREWDESSYRKVLANWPNKRPTVFVSFDHPKIRVSIPEQIEHAEELLKGRSNVLTEILLKPETTKQRRIQIESIIPRIEAMKSFDIIGITEKELGFTYLERMESIALIRLAMEECNIIKPLHIFGSLDPVATPLYFVSGADIFDGLAWLRYAFVNGIAIYEQNYSALYMPLDSKERQIWVNRINQNITHLGHLKHQMTQYLHDGRFKHFTYHRQLIENSFNLLLAKVEQRE